MFCTGKDVEKRLRRQLTGDEEEYLDGMIEEAEVLVLGYLECPADRFADAVPDAVRLVTSRMVARVIQEGDIAPDDFGAVQYGATAGPFSQQRTFVAGSRTGAPWLTKVDKSALDPFRCGGKAFQVDTAPRGGSLHSVTCSANDYVGAPHWFAYCTCGADIAGKPIFEANDVS